VDAIFPRSGIGATGEPHRRLEKFYSSEMNPEQEVTTGERSTIPAQQRNAFSGNVGVRLWRFYPTARSPGHSHDGDDFESSIVSVGTFTVSTAASGRSRGPTHDGTLHGYARTRSRWTSNAARLRSRQGRHDRLRRLDNVALA